MLLTIRKQWVPAVMGLMLIFGVATVFNVGRDVGRSFGGFLPTRNHFRNLWQVDPSTPPWWPALALQGLRYDDTLLALEGEPYGTESYRRYDRARQEQRTSVTLAVLRGTAVVHFNLPVRTFTLGDFLDTKLPDLINGFGFWLLAIAVYRARPQETANRVFALASSLYAGAAWTYLPGLSPEAGALTRTLQVAWILVMSFLAAVFIHATLLFPQPSRLGSRRWLTALYVLMTIVGALYALSMPLAWQGDLSRLARRLSTLGNGTVAGATGLGVGLYMVRLAWLAGRPDSSRRLRRQVAFLLGGLALASPYLTIVLLRALGTHGYFWNQLDLRCMVLPIPISLAFVILRYQTFQGMHPTVLGALILASSALVGSVGAWAMRLAEPAWVNSLVWSPFMPLFVAALISGLFWSLQSSWQGAFSRLLNWDRRSYSAARQFGQRVIHQLEISQVPGVIATALVSKLELERAAVWLWNEKQEVFELAGQAGAWPEQPAVTLRPPGLPGTGGPLRLQPEAGPGWLEPLRRAGSIEVVAPLGMSGRPVGLLGLGKRWDEEIFDERDLEVVELIAQQAALLLLTAMQVEELRRVPHQIDFAQERERFKIAQELHDTVQQFLGRLPFYLEVSRKLTRENPAETEAILERCVSDVESAAQTVRAIRNNLAPLQLEKSLTEPLQMLIQHFCARSGLETEVSISPKADSYLSLEARHALYRVVQQALDNVAIHAGASRVVVTVTPENGRVRFTVADNGRGFSEQQRAQAEDRGSFGLKSMQARISSLDGELELQTAPGFGTRISGWLPAGTEKTPG